MPRIIYEDVDEWLEELADCAEAVYRKHIRMTKLDDDNEQSKGAVKDIELRASFAVEGDGGLEVVECMVQCGEDVTGSGGNTAGSDRYARLAEKIRKKCGELELKVRGGTWVEQ